MFREMRRKRQLLSEKDSIAVLEKGTSGVLSLLGDDGYPYGVPMSYVYIENKIFFHCAKEGYKIDAIRKCDKASFCVIDQDDIVPEKYTTYFRSVIVFGKVRILTDKSELQKAIEKLAIKYHPKDDMLNREKEISKGLNLLYVIELSIEHMTGKEAIEIAKKNK